MWIFSDIYDIFFDSSPNFDIENISVDNFTDKYQQEIDNVYFDEIFVATTYKNIEILLERYKFYSDQSNYKIFWKIFQKTLRQIPEKLANNVDILSDNVEENFYKNFVITSVPMFWGKFFTRGFDHMAKIAKYLSKQEEIPYKKLLKTRFTQKQSWLSKIERQKNRKNKYILRKNIEVPEYVILLDDVVSTASSVNECAKVLKSAGVKYVLVLVLATNI